jgi:hypothetical protein
MARALSLAAMVTRAQQFADLPITPISPPTTTDIVTSAEWVDMTNAAITEVFDALVAAAPPDYYSADQPITVTAGTTSYALPATFRTLVAVYQIDSTTGRRVEIRALRREELEQVSAPTIGVSLSMEYVPAPPFLSDPADTFDGVSGWEECVSLVAARNAMDKQQQDSSAIQRRVMELRDRMTPAHAKRAVVPQYINRAPTRRGAWGNAFSAASSNPLVGYRLRGSSLEVYQPLWGPVV